ncbi:MAG: hypothetical protein JNK85_10760 [Verrucomicrobiales bacterium]|nr:hypothetical protein [Verrucomicrobiales bacterium]
MSGTTVPAGNRRAGKAAADCRISPRRFAPVRTLGPGQRWSSWSAGVLSRYLNGNRPDSTEMRPAESNLTLPDAEVAGMMAG